MPVPEALALTEHASVSELLASLRGQIRNEAERENNASQVGSQPGSEIASQSESQGTSIYYSQPGSAHAMPPPLTVPTRSKKRKQKDLTGSDALSARNEEMRRIIREYDLFQALEAQVKERGIQVPDLR